MQGYIRQVAAREREARALYGAEDVDEIKAEEFIRMLVLDGCFIIEHLVNVATGKQEQWLHATPFGPAQLSVGGSHPRRELVLVDLINSTRVTRLPEFDSPPAITAAT
ncbi:hypothetical protein BAE44_0001952 [Dichanthelium oligosanthes]|uniref:Uncharacterized protein n=1 Tax=Dichanthelium oligosanthes TaxID=888268 RepID=A0A1E5WIR8_9POAL|nr:hypothetical protein BAE44_0001952 [Dichanthelium oligosanthes]